MIALLGCDCTPPCSSRQRDARTYQLHTLAHACLGVGRGESYERLQRPGGDGLGLGLPGPHRLLRPQLGVLRGDDVARLPRQHRLQDAGHVDVLPLEGAGDDLAGGQLPVEKVVVLLEDRSVLLFLSVLGVPLVV